MLRSGSGLAVMEVTGFLHFLLARAGPGRARGGRRRWCSGRPPCSSGFVFPGETAVLLGRLPGLDRPGVGRGAGRRGGGRRDRRRLGRLRGRQALRSAAAAHPAVPAPRAPGGPGPRLPRRPGCVGDLRRPVHRVPARRHAGPRRAQRHALPALPGLQRRRRPGLGSAAWSRATWPAAPSGSRSTSAGRCGGRRVLVVAALVVWRVRGTAVATTDETPGDPGERPCPPTRSERTGQAARCSPRGRARPRAARGRRGPVPERRPPRASRPCGVSQPARSGPFGTICVGLMSECTT